MLVLLEHRDNSSSVSSLRQKEAAADGPALRWLFLGRLRGVSDTDCSPLGWARLARSHGWPTPEPQQRLPAGTGEGFSPLISDTAQARRLLGLLGLAHALHL